MSPRLQVGKKPQKNKKYNTKTLKFRFWKFESFLTINLFFGLLIVYSPKNIKFSFRYYLVYREQFQAEHIGQQVEKNHLSVAYFQQVPDCCPF